MSIAIIKKTILILLLFLIGGCAGRGLPALTEPIPEGNSGVQILEVQVNASTPGVSGGADGYVLQFFNGVSLPPGTYELPHPRDSSRKVTVIIGPDGKVRGQAGKVPQ